MPSPRQDSDRPAAVPPDPARVPGLRPPFLSAREAAWTCAALRALARTLPAQPPPETRFGPVQNPPDSARPPDRA